MNNLRIYIFPPQSSDQKILCVLALVDIMILRRLLALIQLVLVSNSTPLETSVQLNRQFLPGLFPNYNLCQIFSPVSIKDDGKFFTGAKNTPEINSHVRYIVLHKCRWTAKQDNLYGPFLNKAYECEDTSFVQVNNTLLIGFILSEVTKWCQNLFNVAFEFLFLMFFYRSRKLLGLTKCLKMKLV